MKYSILATTLLVAGGAAVLSACVQEPAPICNMGAIASQRQLAAAPSRVPGGESPLLEMPLNSVNVTDYAIINKVYVRTVNARRTPTGTVQVYTQIVNCTDFPLNAEARVQFYDAGQAPSEPVSAWKRFALPARTSNTYSENSIGTQSAAFYMVELRETK
jgi:hypothetical protein